MTVKKIICLCLGFLGLALGALGAFLPILPSVPFLLLAACCFGKSSERLNRWFRGTRLYKNNLESYVKGEGMSKKSKARLIVCLTLLMSVGFGLMARKRLYIPCAVLFAVWLGHVIYFGLIVKNPARRAEKA